jgi:pSer/pThr/pTyr-binding forkhead associated (FHA) protein
MPRLILQFAEKVLNESSLGVMTTIGRLPDNTIIIDNPAVSSHHACVFREGDDFFVEDLRSKNGTFVNDTRVAARCALKDGDAIRVGTHTLVFDRAGGDAVADDPKPLMLKAGGTVFLDQEKHKAVLATLPSTTDDAAVLRVLAGKANQSEFRLDAHTSRIGKAATSVVRLRGWFKPDLAVVITRSFNGYVATPFQGQTFINGEPLRGRHNLQDGDVMHVGGLALEFRTRA